MTVAAWLIYDDIRAGASRTHPWWNNASQPLRPSTHELERENRPTISLLTRLTSTFAEKQVEETGGDSGGGKTAARVREDRARTANT